MATQENSNELRVERVSNEEIEEHLRNKQVAIGCASYTVKETRTVDKEGTEGSASDDTSTGGGAKVEYIDGNTTNITILLPIDRNMDVQASELSEEEREKIEAKAEKSQANKEKERDGLGE